MSHWSASWTKLSGRLGWAILGLWTVDTMDLALAQC